MILRVKVQNRDFLVASEYEKLRKDARCGAVVTFTGLVRELSEAELLSMTVEHYPGMTEQALTQIATEAQQRWQLSAITIIHRVGTLLPNEQIVFVGVATTHRVAGFAAAEFIMDYLKNRAPFWKKEQTTKGDYWIEAKASDQVALNRWE